MKYDLDRVKNDLATMQKAIGGSPYLGRDWVQWMKRDNWANLWWCVPGLILISSALLPLQSTVRYFGLLPAQWTGLLVCAAILWIASVLCRKLKSNADRPESLVREYYRINGFTRQGFWLNVALVVGLALFAVWSKQNHLSFSAFWSGLFIFLGTSFLVTAIAAREKILLGWALPFLAYGLFETFASGGQINGVALGFMFIAVALSFSFIQAARIKQIESQHGTH